MQMTCMEAVKKLVDYLNQELTSYEHEKVIEHLQACNACCDKFEFEEKLSELIKNKTQGDICPDKIKANIMDRLRKSYY